MVSREEITGHWNEIKGRLQEHWGQLTDDDLQRAKGATNELYGIIQEKTGATRAEVEGFLDRVLSEGDSIKRRATDAAKNYSDTAQQYAEEVERVAHEQYARAAAAQTDLANRVSHSVRTNPGQALAIAFGVGILTGACLLFNSRKAQQR